MGFGWVGLGSVGLGLGWLGFGWGVRLGWGGFPQAKNPRSSRRNARAGPKNLDHHCNYKICFTAECTSRRRE